MLALSRWVNDMDKQTHHKILLVWVLVFSVCSFVIGGYVGYYLSPEKTITKKETITEQVKIPVKGETQTIIKYVERDKDDPAQVKIDAEQPQFVAEINGKQYNFETLTGETHAFEKGQLVVKQTSKTTIDMTDWANKELARENERLKKKYDKKFAAGVSALTGKKQTYVGGEVSHKIVEAGAWQQVRGDGDDRLYKLGLKWRF